MQYLTTKCRNCGYRTRDRETGVPKVQIGTPILICPRCGHLILDSIQTEYEFMTDKEKERFSSQSAFTRSIFGNIFFIVFGLIFLIGSITIGGGYIAVGIICGGGMIALGVYQITKNQASRNNKDIEQAVYESLKRTENKDYVKYIETAYNSAGIDRKYKEFTDKNNFINENKNFEERSSYKENMEYFNELLNKIGINTTISNDKTSAFYHH